MIDLLKNNKQKKRRKRPRINPRERKGSLQRIRKSSQRNRGETRRVGIVVAKETKYLRGRLQWCQMVQKMRNDWGGLWWPWQKQFGGMVRVETKRGAVGGLKSERRRGGGAAVVRVGRVKAKSVSWVAFAVLSLRTGSHPRLTPTHVRSSTNTAGGRSPVHPEIGWQTS